MDKNKNAVSTRQRKEEAAIKALSACALKFGVPGNGAGAETKTAIAEMLASNFTGMELASLMFSGEMPRGLCYGVNVNTGENIFLDRTMFPNKNGIVFGNDGAGKGFFVKGEIFQAANQYKVYKLGGKSSDFHINPFDMVIDWEASESPISKKAAEITAFYRSLSNGQIAENDDTIARCCDLLYKPYLEEMMKQKSPDQKYAVDYSLCPTARDFYYEIKGFDMKYAELIEPYIDYLSYQTDIEDLNKMSIINLSGVPSELLSFMIYESILFAQNASLSRTNLTWIYIDQMWSVVKDYGPQMYTIWKKSENSILTGIVGDVTEFQKNGSGRDIMAASDFMVSFRLDAFDRKNIRQLGNVNERVSEHIKDTAEPGNGLLFTVGREPIMFRYQIKDEDVSTVLSTKDMSGWSSHVLSRVEQKPLELLYATDSGNNQLCWGYLKDSEKKILQDLDTPCNTAIFGTSGSGKSYLAKASALQKIQNNIDVIAIDQTGSFETLTKYLGNNGYKTEVIYCKDIKINPFDLIPPGYSFTKDAIQKAIEEKVDFIISILESLCGHELNPFEVNCVYRCCQEMYKPYLKRLKTEVEQGNIKSHYDFCPTFRNFWRLLLLEREKGELIPEAKRISKIIEDHEDIIISLMSCQTTLEITAAMTSLDLMDHSLSDTESDLMTKLCESFVWNHTLCSYKKNEGRNRISVYLDNGYPFFSSYMSYRYFIRHYALANDYNCEMTLILQDVSDICTVAKDLEILNLSGVCVFQNMFPVAREQVKNYFKMTNSLALQINNCPAGNGLICINPTHEMITEKTVVLPYTFHVDKRTDQLLSSFNIERLNA